MEELSDSVTISAKYTGLTIGAETVSAVMVAQKDFSQAWNVWSQERSLAGMEAAIGGEA